MSCHTFLILDMKWINLFALNQINHLHSNYFSPTLYIRDLWISFFSPVVNNIKYHIMDHLAFIGFYWILLDQLYSIPCNNFEIWFPLLWCFDILWKQFPKISWYFLCFWPLKKRNNFIILNICTVYANTTNHQINVSYL